MKGFTLFHRSPLDASTFTPRVDALLLALVIVSAIVVTVLAAMILVFLIRYRRGSPAPRPPLRLTTWKFEAAWISGTTAVFLVFFFWGTRIFLDIGRPPADAGEIDVVGRQWMWDIRHPDGRREFDELHVPVDQPIRLRLTSEDVIHSFAVPAFSIKQDVVPGKVTMAWFEATRIGSYRFFCDQFCGTGHAEMSGQVVVLSPEDYATWLGAGNVSNRLSDRGRELFVRYGCSGCHTPGSPIHAPSLVGLYGRLVPVEDGKFVRADEQYLYDSIVLPKQHIVAGYDAIMPEFKGVIPPADVLDLVTYLKSLGAKSPPAAAPYRRPIVSPSVPPTVSPAP